MAFEYDVFFSYRHRPLDGEITQKAFNLVESYRLPAALREQGYPEIRRAFRDTEELPVSRILTDTIDAALRSTNCLVVVCSPDTPTSEWIDREVAMFIELGRAEFVYPLLIAGDPEHSFPPSLKRIPDVLDRVMDIRVEGNPVKKMMDRAETEMLKVISGIVGCGQAELEREHALRKNRRFARKAGAIAAAFILVSGISLLLMRQAQTYRQTAQQRETAAMSILNELTYSLPDHLTNVPGAYSRIAGILEDNTEDINAILRLSRNKEAAEYEAAANYEKLANASSVLGSYDRALRSEQEALDRFEALAVDGYEKGSQALPSAYSNRAKLLNLNGDYEGAAADYRQAVRLLEENGAGDPLLLAQVCGNAGANAIDLGDAEAAARDLEKCLALLADLPESEEVTETAASANFNYGLSLYRGGAYAPAAEKLREACLLYQQLLDHSDSLLNRQSLIRASSLLAPILTDAGQYEEADRWYEKAIDAARLLAADQENMDTQLLLAQLYNNHGLSYNIRGDYAKADALYTDAAALYGRVSRVTGAVPDRIAWANALLNTGENRFKLGDDPGSREMFEAGLREYEALTSQLEDFDLSQYYAWRSYYLLIHARDPEAALEAGLAAVRLQPDNVLANMNLAYACLYAGYEDDCDALLTQIAALGEGQADTIRLDLEAQQRAGLESEHRAALLAMLDA